MRIPSRVIVIAPKHHAQGADWAVAPYQAWRLPGATLAGDPELAQRLAQAMAGLELDAEKHRVTRDGKLVNLTAREFELLHALMSSPGKAFSREELLQQCYQNSEAGIDRDIDVHIGKLRQKIEDDPSRPCFILTVRGHGYSFRDENPGG